MVSPAKLIKTSAPAVAKLFGEHAIAHGYSAIALAIDLRTYITVRKINQEYSIFQFKNIGLSKLVVQYKNGKFNLITLRKNIQEELKYFITLINVFENEFNVKFSGIEVTVESNIPINSGLASSAAFLSSLTYAFSKFYNLSLDLDSIAKICYGVEKLVQGIASPMDTTISTFGGVYYINLKENIFQKLNITSFPKLIILQIDREGTTKELVHKVNNLKQKYPDVVENIFKTIHEIVNQGLKCLEENNFECIGNLMFINHHLLSSLGVSNEKCDFIIEYLRKIGVLGAKISGAGGGGTIIVLAPGMEEHVCKFIKPYVRNVYITNLTNIGVRDEY